MRRKLFFALMLCLALVVTLGIAAPIAAATLHFDVSIMAEQAPEGTDTGVWMELSHRR